LSKKVVNKLIREKWGNWKNYSSKKQKGI